MEWPLDSIRAAAEEERRHAIPAETEAMRKTRAVANKALAAGTRALLYGSVAAAAGVVGGGLRWIEESTVVRDLRRKFRMRRPDEAPSSR